MCLDEKWVREACPVSCQAQTEMCAPMQSYRLQAPVAEVASVGSFAAVDQGVLIVDPSPPPHTRVNPGVLIVDPRPPAPTPVNPRVLIVDPRPPTPTPMNSAVLVVDPKPEAPIPIDPTQKGTIVCTN